MSSLKQTQFDELAAYLTAKNEHARAFARRAGIDSSVFWRLLTGKSKRWDPVIIEKISSATDGLIGGEQFAAFARRRATADPIRQGV